MNLYLVSQDANNDYDTFDSFVVACETEEVARNTFPREHMKTWGECMSSWARGPDQVQVELIGVDADGIRSGIILASFNAG